MKEIIFNTDIYSFDTFREFVEEFQVDEQDLIITNAFILTDSIRQGLKADVICQEQYGAGEPSDEMVEAMYGEISSMKPHKRIIGIGGGTVLDISKLFALKYVHPVEELYDGKLPVEKDKELVLIPTTCGTGSEVTNISILAFQKRNTKMGLATDKLYADKAVLIPEFLGNLPFRFFATSSVDAFIHGVESSLSPKATPYTELYGYKAVEIILKGYQMIAREGEQARNRILKEFLIASNFAGLAFGTAGCGPVHALSYPLGGTFHVAHGEANYAVFSGVMEHYQKKAGVRLESLERLKAHMASVLDCKEEQVLEELETLLGAVIRKKSLKEYGADQEMLKVWSQSVLDTQQRLMKNSPFELGYEDVLHIYQSLFE